MYAQLLWEALLYLVSAHYEHGIIFTPMSGWLYNGDV